jgi:hypothetical protein
MMKSAEVARDLTNPTRCGASLRTAFHAMKRGAAPGVDGMTWETYERDLDRRIEELYARARQERIGRCHRVGAIFRKKMEAHARSQSRRSKTKSSREPWRRC